MLSLLVKVDRRINMKQVLVSVIGMMVEKSQLSFQVSTSLPLITANLAARLRLVLSNTIGAKYRFNTPLQSVTQADCLYRAALSG